jgi:hypothetical protein
LVITDLVPIDDAPRPLFGALDREKSSKLMAAMDACNSRFGRGAGAGGAGRDAHVVDEVRDAIAAIHDAVGRGADGWRSRSVRSPAPWWLNRCF